MGTQRRKPTDQRGRVVKRRYRGRAWWKRLRAELQRRHEYEFKLLKFKLDLKLAARRASSQQAVGMHPLDWAEMRDGSSITFGSVFSNLAPTFGTNVLLSEVVERGTFLVAYAKDRTCPG